jgi:hypothetical protein
VNECVTLKAVEQGSVVLVKEGAPEAVTAAVVAVSSWVDEGAGRSLYPTDTKSIWVEADEDECLRGVVGANRDVAAGGVMKRQ